MRAKKGDRVKAKYVGYYLCEGVISSVDTAGAAIDLDKPIRLESLGSERKAVYVFWHDIKEVLEKAKG